MLPRVLEPEVMDTTAEAEDYDSMDHAEVNRRFVDDFLQAFGKMHQSFVSAPVIFDAGTGTAQIPIELLSREIPFEIHAVDLSEEMLVVARRNVEKAGFGNRIRVKPADCKALMETSGSYDAVISNSIIHHIPEPLAVFKECWRILKPGGLLFLRDLLRPSSEAELERLVTLYGGPHASHGAKMFRDSLWAALTVEEVQAMAATLGIPQGSVRTTSDRHWTLEVVKT